MGDPGKGRRLLPLLIALALPMAGCWDQVESEDRGFVVGTAIDPGEKASYKLTYQFVIPGSMQTSNKPATGGRPYMNLTTEGQTVFRANREMAARTSRSPYLEHMRIILLSRELAMQGRLQKVLDLFIRDHEMRRACKVLITEGNAASCFTIDSPNDKLPVLFIESVANNRYKTSRILTSKTLGELQGDLLGKRAFTIPRIEMKGKDIEVQGAGVFDGREHRMIGELDGMETTALSFLTGKLKSNVVQIRSGEGYLAFETKAARTRIQADVSDPERPLFHYRIDMEGDLGESSIPADFTKPEAIAMLENRTEEEVGRLTEGLVRKLQQDLKTDVLGLGEYLRENHYRTWKKLEDDWDTGENVFSRCRIRITVHTRMRNIGAIIQSESE